MVDRPQDPREDPLAVHVSQSVPEPGEVPGVVRPRDVDRRGTGVEVDRQGGCHADERQSQMIGNSPARHLHLIDKDGVVRNVWHKVKVPGHVAEVLKAAKAL